MVVRQMVRIHAYREALRDSRLFIDAMMKKLDAVDIKKANLECGIDELLGGHRMRCQEIIDTEAKEKSAFHAKLEAIAVKKQHHVDELRKAESELEVQYSDQMALLEREPPPCPPEDANAHAAFHMGFHAGRAFEERKFALERRLREMLERERDRHARMIQQEDAKLEALNQNASGPELKSKAKLSEERSSLAQSLESIDKRITGLQHQSQQLNSDYHEQVARLEAKQVFFGSLLFGEVTGLEELKIGVQSRIVQLTDLSKTAERAKIA